MTQQPGIGPMLDTYGAVDLSRLTNPAPVPDAGGAAGTGGAYTLDVTEQTFEAAVLVQSQTVPVVLDMWATWCEPCKQLSPVLERLVAADGGRWVLAKIDIDANQQLAGALAVQSIPAVFAVIGGQIMPLFQGALPEAEVRRVIDEVLRFAEANGITGTAPAPEAGTDADEGAEPPAPDPLVDGATAALPAALAVLRGLDLKAAADSYKARLDAAPADHDAKVGLARVQLLQRLAAGGDPAGGVAGGVGADPLAAQEHGADVAVADGRFAEGFALLIDAVRHAQGADRERLRAHLVSLFEVVGSDDPAVGPARTALANALF